MQILSKIRHKTRIFRQKNRKKGNFINGSRKKYKFCRQIAEEVQILSRHRKKSIMF